jgi:hypothetical protein
LSRPFQPFFHGRGNFCGIRSSKKLPPWHSFLMYSLFLKCTQYALVFLLHTRTMDDLIRYIFPVMFTLIIIVILSTTIKIIFSAYQQYRSRAYIETVVERPHHLSSFSYDYEYEYSKTFSPFASTQMPNYPWHGPPRTFFSKPLHHHSNCDQRGLTASKTATKSLTHPYSSYQFQMDLGNIGSSLKMPETKSYI